ncbi:carbamoyl phosphate synthase small subunit [Bacillaceae bacterium]
MKGYLVLSTGDVFAGEWLGGKGAGEGEVVFNTGMTGYQEVMTDPSYAGQIVTFTYPLIGNYGVNEHDDESVRPALSGMLVGELCDTPSHYLAKHSLAEMAAKFDIPVLAGVDTRAVTKIVRERGEVYGKITTAPEEAQGFRGGRLLNPVPLVSCKEPVSYPGEGPHIVLIDFGVKKSIRDALLQLGCAVTVVPYDVSYDTVVSLQPDGILLSNGPGDPKDLSPLLGNLKKIVERYPTLGICLGHQLIALMYGGDTERLPYGHRGNNHPVKELLTGKVYITPQNHGYVVKEESLDKKEWIVSYRNVNDKSIEGLQHRHLPIATVQFHPEAHPGPSDTQHVFRQFIQQCQRTGEKSYA